MKLRLTMKKTAAICLSIVMSALIFVGSTGTTLESHADNKDKKTSHSAYDKKLSQLENEQKRLEKEIEQAEEQIKQSDNNMESLKIKTAALEKQIKSYQKQAEQIEMEIAQVDDQLRKAQSDLEKQETNIQKSTDDFMERIRTMYVAGTINSYSQVILSSQDFYDILMRTELVKRVAEHDNKQLNSLLAEKRKLEETKQTISQSLEKLKKTSDTYVKKQQELADKQTELSELQQQEQENSKNLKQQKAELSQKNEEISEKYGVVFKKARKAEESEKAEQEAKARKKAAEESRRKKNAVVATKKSSTSSGSKNNTGSTNQTPSATTRVPQNTTKATTQAPVTQAPAPATTRPAATTTQKPVTQTPSASGGIDKVLAYAKSNVGGAYVWGGSNFRATDCSGLVMLSYAQIGISLPHQASAQANYGRVVSYNDMQPGDLIFFGSGGYSSIYHVAIYIGNGLMVHAENSSTGIVISSVAGFSSSNRIEVIKRLV